MKGGSVSVVCKGYITKVVWRAILALSGAWGPRELVILDSSVRVCVCVWLDTHRRLVTERKLHRIRHDSQSCRMCGVRL